MPFDDGDLLMDYLDRLAHCAAELRLDALPASTVTAAKLVLLDTLGAIIAGSRLPENARLARLAGVRAPHGAATLLGHGGAATPAGHRERARRADGLKTIVTARDPGDWIDDQLADIREKAQVR